MEHMVSCRQSHHIAGLFGTNVDWEAIPFEAGEAISGDPTGFGRNATRFVQNGGRVTVMMTDGIIPPPGGRIQILTAVVDESRSWEDAVKAAGPDTGRDWDIWKVGGKYPPRPRAKPSLKHVVLCNFGKIIESCEEALTWGKEQKLKPVTPRVVFSISEHYPDLDQYLGIRDMDMLALQKCLCDGFQCVTYICFEDSRRKAIIDRFDINQSSYNWFVFEHESS